MRIDSVQLETGHQRKSGKWFWTVFSVTIGLASLPLLLIWLEPSYNGRRISDWFEQAVQENSPNYHDSESFRAFWKMEGRAVPYLARWIKAQPSWFDQRYAALMAILPARVQKALPPPRVHPPFYNSRRMRALELLGSIGAMQRFKLESGQPVAGTRAATAVPVLRDSLDDRDSGIRAFAVQALGSIGPSAAPAVPRLIEIARSSDATTAAQSLGLIGPAASNAVEVLVLIASGHRFDRVSAVQSLGRIGSAACRAAPKLAGLVEDPDEAICFQAARALAEIGTTPDEAVPALVRMRQSTNQWARIPASLALWNRNRDDRELTDAIADALRSEKRAAVAVMLGHLGTNAQPFAPAIRAMLQNSDPVVRRAAAGTLRKIESAQP